MSNKLSINIQSSQTLCTGDFNPDGTIKDIVAVDDNPSYDVVVSDDECHVRLWLGKPPYPDSPEALFRYAWAGRTDEVYDAVMFRYSLQLGMEVDGAWFDFDDWKDWLDDNTKSD